MESMENRANPLTESKTQTVRSKYSKGEWEIVECLETGMVYLNNPPDYTQLNEEYAWEKTYEEEKARRYREEPVITWVSQRVKHFRLKRQKREKMAAIAASLLRQFPEAKSLRVLDLGCGGGDKLEKLIGYCERQTQAQLEPWGIDISKALAAAADALFKKRGGQCLEMPVLEGLQHMEAHSVHIAILSSYLEHELHPVAILRALKSRLVAGGFAVIKVPNYACWNRKIRQQKWCGFRYPDHVNYFTPKTLKGVVERAGLEVYRMGVLDKLPTSDNMYLIARRAK